MKFYGKITVNRYAEDNWNPEITEIYADHFQAPSIQSAKAHLTKIANGQTALLLGSVLGQRNTGIHRQRLALETLEFTACYL